MNSLFPHNSWLKKHKPWFIFAIATLFIIAVCLLFVFFMKSQPWSMDKRGQLGDMFGVLGAVFSGLAFAGLIVTLIQQHDDLKLQREDLRLQRQTIAQTNIELSLHRKEMEEQNKTIMLQRFENTFFSMLDNHQSILRDMLAIKRYETRDSNGNVTGNKEEEYRGRDAMFRFLWTITSQLNQKEKEPSIEDTRYYFEYKLFNFGRINPYFQQLYSIMDFVDSNTMLSINEKYKYICTLRATLSFDETILVFYYGLSKHGNKRFKKLIERYALFEEIQEDMLICKEHKEYYDKGAFSFIYEDILQKSAGYTSHK